MAERPLVYARRGSLHRQLAGERPKRAILKTSSSSSFAALKSFRPRSSSRRPPRFTFIVTHWIDKPGGNACSLLRQTGQALPQTPEPYQIGYCN